MSLVNSNENYLKTMGIYPTQGNARHTAALGGIVAVSHLGSLECPPINLPIARYITVDP